MRAGFAYGHYSGLLHIKKSHLHKTILGRRKKRGAKIFSGVWFQNLEFNMRLIWEVM